MTNWKVRSTNYEKLEWIKNKEFESFFLYSIIDNKPLGRLNFLDIGCGTGIVLKQLIESTDKRHNYYGVDNCEEMLNKCKYLLNTKDVELHKVDCSGKGLIYFDYIKFDVIYSRMCFHHLDDLENVFKTCYKILNDSGIMLICEGVPFSHNIIDEYVEIFKIKEPVRNIMSAEELSNYFIDAGFKDVHIKYFIMEDVSLLNWLNNSDLYEDDIEEIYNLHTTKASDEFKKVYKIQEKDGDVFMRWKFVVVSGVK